MYKFIKINTGWEDTEFESKITEVFNAHTEYEYYDIKITSNGNNCLVILKSIN
jgi:hypothetical protein